MAVSFSRLKATLLTSGTQQTNNPLYQTINQLLDLLIQFQKDTATALSGSGSSNVSDLATFLTSTDQTATLPNSRNLLAGTGITFDDSIAGERTINAGADQDYVVLSDGVPAGPQPVNDGAGNFIYIPYVP